jgi:hypothetical protein
MVPTAPLTMAQPITRQPGLTREAQAYRPPTAQKKRVKPTIRPPARMRVARRHPGPTAARQRLKRTTQIRERMPQLIKPPMPTETMETRFTPRMARRPTRSIRLRPMVPRERCKLQRAARVRLRALLTAIRARTKRPMVTSTRRRTATSTRTPAAVGSKPKEPHITIAQVTREARTTTAQVPRNRTTTARVPRKARTTMAQVPRAGQALTKGTDSRNTAAPRPLAAADGNRERTALAVPIVEVAAAAGEGKPVLRTKLLY